MYRYSELEDLGEIAACLDISWSEDGIDWQIAWLNLSDPNASLVIPKDPVRVYPDEGIAKQFPGSKTAFWGQTYRFFIYPKGDAHDGPTSYSFTYSFPETPTLTPKPSVTSVPTETPVPTLVRGGVKSGDYTIDVYSNGTCHITDYHGSVANLVVPQMLEGYVVTKIREDAFWGCYMEQLTLPDTVTDIGNYAFRSCGSLKSVTLPPNISAISAYTFYSCRSLENVTVPGSARYIDGFAFAYCTSLTDVTIQPGVLEIRMEAFIGCTSLTSVTIPDSVTDIHYRAFMHCPNLTLRVPRNSYAATYAQQNNIPYIYID